MTLAERFARLPTAAKLLLILTAVLLPIGIALAWLGESGIRQANAALEGRSQDQSRAAADGIESLIARNALALRVAANGALADGTGGACERAQRSLVDRARGRPELRAGDGPTASRCARSATSATPASLPLVAPGDIRVRIAPDAGCGRDPRRRDRRNGDRARCPSDEIRTAALEAPARRRLRSSLHDDARELQTRRSAVRTRIRACA